MKMYMVQAGDCLSIIEQHFNVTRSAMLFANPEIANVDKIRAGQWLRIPEILTWNLNVTIGNNPILEEICAAKEAFIAQYNLIPKTLYLGSREVQLLAWHRVQHKIKKTDDLIYGMKMLFVDVETYINFSV